jgi:hypothetical protein
VTANLTNVAELDERISALWEDIRNLVEQAAAYSGAADDELEWRIVEQEAELKRLLEQRHEVLSAPQSS